MGTDMVEMQVEDAQAYVPQEAGAPAPRKTYNFTKKRRHRQSRSHTAVRLQLLTRERLDARHGAIQVFDKLISDIENSLGGRDVLSPIALSLVETYASAVFTMRAVSAKMVLGQEVDFGLLALTGGLMVKIAAKLGLERRAMLVEVPSVEEYSAHLKRKAAESEKARAMAAVEDVVL